MSMQMRCCTFTLTREQNCIPTRNICATYLLRQDHSKNEPLSNSALNSENAFEDAQYTFFDVDSCHPFPFGSYSGDIGMQRGMVWKQGKFEAEECRRYIAGVPHYNCRFRHICDQCQGEHRRMPAPREMRSKERIEEWRRTVRKPRYMRGLIWGDKDTRTPLASSTVFREPLKGVLDDDFSHELVTQTLEENAYLFKIVMPICYEILEVLLQRHPNRGLVDSVIGGFKDGFWPAARADMLVASAGGHDNRRREVEAEGDKQDFLKLQRDVEVTLERYSPSFGPNLFPGMVVQPCFAVPKNSV
jgi:hypothetical protein